MKTIVNNDKYKKEIFVARKLSGYTDDFKLMEGDRL